MAYNLWTIKRYKIKTSAKIVWHMNSSYESIIEIAYDKMEYTICYKETS